MSRGFLSYIRVSARDNLLTLTFKISVFEMSRTGCILGIKIILNLDVCMGKAFFFFFEGVSPISLLFVQKA